MLIQDAGRKARQQYGEELQLVLAGDFNCHNELWGGDEAALTASQGEAMPILENMEELELESLLPRGTVTWENATSHSTLDLMLLSQSLAESHLKRRIHQTEHGSDHYAIETELDVDLKKPQRQLCYVFKNAPWNQI